MGCYCRRLPTFRFTLVLSPLVKPITVIPLMLCDNAKCFSSFLRWWNSTGLAEKLSFVRDRLVECFIWGMGTNFEPDLGNVRRVITKVVSLATTIDDIYDMYGTFEELKLFTEAIDRLISNHCSHHTF